MKLISIVVGLGALGWIALAIERWWFRFPDTSQLVLALGIGFAFLGGAYLYGWMHKKDEVDRKQNERIDAMVNWWMNREQDAIREIARGKENE